MCHQLSNFTLTISSYTIRDLERLKGLSREGVIIEWPLNGQFHDACDVIMTFRTDVLGVDDDDVDDDDELSIFTQKRRYKMLKWRQICSLPALLWGTYLLKIYKYRA